MAETATHMNHCEHARPGCTPLRGGTRVSQFMEMKGNPEVLAVVPLPPAQERRRRETMLAFTLFMGQCSTEAGA